MNIYSENLDLFKEMYYHQLEQKDSINSRISIPVGILSLLCAGGLYYINNINNLYNTGWKIVFIIILSMFFVSIIITIYFTLRAYYGYEYNYIALPSEINTYFNNLVKYYETNYDEFFSTNPNSSKEELIENDIDAFLCTQYIECTDNNIELNETKLIYLRKVGWCLISSLILGSVSLLPYSLSVKNKDDEPQKIKIINISDLKNGGYKNMSNSTNNTNQPATLNSIPKKPTPPSPRVLNENFSLTNTNNTKKAPIKK